ncbi:MAG: heavy-metal-associated domain-containing protein [Pelolinea sp.]|nr:heavy-metal-associated domain-containing protein [Pelolinea sp.]
METVKYSVPSIHCGHCVKTIEMEMGEVKGVSRVKADLNSKTVEVDFGAPASEEIVVATLRELNYPPETGK